MWTDTTREQFARSGLCLPSDLTGGEWAVLEPLLPRRLHRGRPSVWSDRARRIAVRRRDRQPECDNDRKNLLSMSKGGGPRGYDAGKKIKGCKRYILTKTEGLRVGAVVHTADIQDRDRAPDVLASIRYSVPWLRHVFADGGAVYPERVQGSRRAAQKLCTALTKIGKWALQIITRSDRAKGFEALPQRWVVERTFARLERNRRPAKDFERIIQGATAWLSLASIQLMIRRIVSL